MNAFSHRCGSTVVGMKWATTTYPRSQPRQPRKRSNVSFHTRGGATFDGHRVGCAIVLYSI